MLRALALLLVVLVRTPTIAAVIFEDGTFDPARWDVTQLRDPAAGVCREDEHPLFTAGCSVATVSGPCGCADMFQARGGFGTYLFIHQEVFGDGQITWFHHLKDATYDPRGPQGPLVSLDYAEDAMGEDVDEEEGEECLFSHAQTTGPAVRQNDTIYIRPGLFTKCTWTHEEVRGLVAADFVAIDGCCEPHPDFSGQGPEADASLELGFFRANAVTGNGPIDERFTWGGIENFRIVVDPVCVADDDCDDRDECTSDTCVGGRCTRAHLPGFDGVRCELRRARTALRGVCGHPPRVNLPRRLRARLAQTERVLAGGRGSARAATRRQRKALRLLRGAETLIRREVAHKLHACVSPIFAALVDRISGLLEEIDVGK